MEADLQGIAIRVQGTDLVARIDRTEPWNQVGPKYLREKSAVNMSTLNLGEAWAFDIPFRKMQQFLIKTQGADTEEGRAQACIRVVRASRFDREANTLNPMTTEGATAKALKMEPGETTQLWLLDPSKPMLYIIRDRIVVAENVQLEGIRNGEPTVAEGDSYLKRLTGE